MLVQSLTSTFDTALRLMEAALTDCTDDLWQADLWPYETPTAPTAHGGLHGSAPWFLGYHALSCLDYDLTGGFEPWAPPRPFDEHTYGFPNRVFTRPEPVPQLVPRPGPSHHRHHDGGDGCSAASEHPPLPRRSLCRGGRKRSRTRHRACRADPAVPHCCGRQHEAHARRSRVLGRHLIQPGPADGVPERQLIRLRRSRSPQAESASRTASTAEPHARTPVVPAAGISPNGPSRSGEHGLSRPPALSSATPCCAPPWTTTCTTTRRGSVHEEQLRTRSTWPELRKRNSGALGARSRGL